MLRSTELTNGINMALVEQLDNTPAVPVEDKPSIKKVSTIAEIEAKKDEKDPAKDKEEFIEAECQKLIKKVMDSYGIPKTMELEKVANEVAEAHQTGRELEYDLALALANHNDAKKDKLTLTQEEIIRKLAKIKSNKEAYIYCKTKKKGAPELYAILPTMAEARDIADFLETYLDWHTIKVGAPKHGEIDEKEYDKAQLYYYNQDTGLYESSNKCMQRYVLAANRNTKSRTRNEVLDYLYCESDNFAYKASKDYVSFNNGVFGMKEEHLLPYSPDQVRLNKLPYNYNPNLTKEPSFDGWTLTSWLEDLAKVNGVVDENKLQLLWQILACALHLYGPPGDLAFWLIDEGQGRSGKGTFQALVKGLAGEANVGALKLKEFQEKFRIKALLKPVVIGDDNPPGGFIDDISVYRSATSHERVTIEDKNEKAFDIYPQALIIQSMNGFPKFRDRTPANLRRQRIIKFEHQLTEKEANSKIKDEYIHDRKLLEWLAQEIIRKELAGELDVENIVDTEESRELRKELQTDIDPVFNFFDQLIHQNNFNSVCFNTDYLFVTYLKWSETKEHVPVKIWKNTFTKEVRTAAAMLGWEYMAKGVPKNKRPGTVRDGHITANMVMADLHSMYRCKPDEDDPLESLNDSDLDSKEKSIIYNPKAFE